MRYLKMPLLLAAIFLQACSDSSFVQPGISVAQSRALVPADADLASVYNRSCRSCHTVAATGAPLTGDALAWSPRMDKGMDVMVDSVVNGFGGMPPFGLCMDCDADQFEALIRFMATPE